MSQRQPLLVHVTNVPTPYRIAFCNTLHAALLDHGWGGLHVLYCTEREPKRQWSVSFKDMAYPHEVLPGISPKVQTTYAHFNPTVIFRLRRLQPDFLLVAGSWNMPTALLAASKFLCGPALRVFWNEGHADAVLNADGPIAWLRRRSLTAYNAFAVPNEASARFIEGELETRPPVLPLPNTVDEEFFRQARFLDRQMVREELELAQDATVFISVAELSEHKGVRELVQSTAFLEGYTKSSLLVLVGDGPLRPELEAIAQKLELPIRIVGHQDQEGVRKWLAAADAFVLATKRDPNPLAVIEAAFAGLPLLVSHKAGNTKELVREGESGIIISCIDSKSIASVLEQFCDLSAQERQRLGFGASKIAESSFRREMVAQNFVAALLDLQKVS